MEILTWNLERLKRNKNGDKIIALLNDFDADIIVLTETSSILDIGNKYNKVQTKYLKNGYDGIPYSSNENRVSIFTKYKILRQHKTYDPFTSICCDVESPFGVLTVYGTIIGVFGGIGKRFKNDLYLQLEDFKRLAINNNLCIIGDFNVFLNGYAYPSHEARNILSTFLEETNLISLTSDIPNNVEHIILPKEILQRKNFSVRTWNENHSFSDHLGICISIN